MKSVEKRVFASPLKTKYRQPFLGLTIAFAVGALVSGAALLVLNCLPWFAGSRFHGVVSAAPLVLIGLASLCLHSELHVPFVQLLKRLLGGVAFILWGVAQMLPPGRTAVLVGDVVIALFVLDLALIIRGELTENPND